MKCGATTVRGAANGLEIGERPNTTYLRPHVSPDFRGIVRNQPAQAWAFACTTCGYLELHLLDAEALAFVAQQWMPITPPAPPPPPPAA